MKLLVATLPLLLVSVTPAAASAGTVFPVGSAELVAKQKFKFCGSRAKESFPIEVITQADGSVKIWIQGMTQFVYYDGVLQPVRKSRRKFNVVLESYSIDDYERDLEALSAARGCDIRVNYFETDIRKLRLKFNKRMTKVKLQLKSRSRYVFLFVLPVKDKTSIKGKGLFNQGL